MEARNEIKDILKFERNRANMTQQEIADYLGIARTSYAQYETGKNIPTTENIIKLADLYSVTTDYMLCRKSIKTKPSDQLVASAKFYEFLLTLSANDKTIFFSGQMPLSQFKSRKIYKRMTPAQQRHLINIYEQEQKKLQAESGRNEPHFDQGAQTRTSP